MELNFDIRGNLKPYSVIELELENFRHNFVEAFDQNLKRSILFDNYLKYMEELLPLLSYDFQQWVDGSFVSNKKKPRDIDFVNILDYRDCENNEQILSEKFASFEGRKRYSVDAYIVKNYPKESQYYILTKSDLLYWENLFGKTKLNRARKQYQKGFIQINYYKDGK